MSLCNFIACEAWCNFKKHTFAAVRIPGTLRFLEGIPGEPQGGNETVTGVLSQSIALFVPDNKWEENIESRDRMGRREALVVGVACDGIPPSSPHPRESAQSPQGLFVESSG